MSNDTVVFEGGFAPALFHSVSYLSLRASDFAQGGHNPGQAGMPVLLKRAISTILTLLSCFAFNR